MNFWIDFTNVSQLSCQDESFVNVLASKLQFPKGDGRDYMTYSTDENEEMRLAVFVKLCRYVSYLVQLPY